jgi:hypothetical protein
MISVVTSDVVSSNFVGFSNKTDGELLGKWEHESQNRTNLEHLGVSSIKERSKRIYKKIYLVQILVLRIFLLGETINLPSTVDDVPCSFVKQNIAKNPNSNWGWYAYHIGNTKCQTPNLCLGLNQTDPATFLMLLFSTFFSDSS